MRGEREVEQEMGAVEVGEPETIDVEGEQVELTPVSVGNPHAVIRRHPDRAELLRLGPLVENHERFPERTNVQLVRVDGAHDITVGVWERGAGETLSSGTSAVAAERGRVANGWCESPVTVHLAGGDLLVELRGRRGDADRPGRGDLHGRARRGVLAVRFAKRLDAVPPYLFAELERKIAEKRREGVDVISLGIGDPDLPTPQVVVEALAEAARDPRTHQYPTNHGSDELREAAADFYRDRFGVELDPATEIVPALGGKEAVGHIAMALLDPGDVCLSPDPGYPPYTSGPLFAGAEPSLPSAAGRATASCPTSTRSRPTCSRARTCSSSTTRTTRPARSSQPGYFERAVEFARANDLVVVHDNAYSEICFEGYRAPSFLETPGAKEVGVEIFSLSKGWNMTGWRSGLVAGQRGGGRALPAAEDEPRLGHVRGRAATRPPSR